jgi:hypothetical protein
MAFEFDAARYRAASQHQQEWGQGLIAELGLKGCWPGSGTEGKG